jgi:hypothetical protein
MKVRVLIPYTTCISYVVEAEKPSVDAVEKVILGDGFDPARWEVDPSLYEKIGDNIREAFHSRRDDIEVEKVEG